MNQGHVKDCAGCGGEHIADQAHTFTDQGGARHYCTTCWPDAPALELLRANAIAAARQGVIAQRYSLVIGLVHSILKGVPRGELVNCALELEKEIDAATEAASRAVLA